MFKLEKEMIHVFVGSFLFLLNATFACVLYWHWSAQRRQINAVIFEKLTGKFDEPILRLNTNVLHLIFLFLPVVVL
jgi:hypothetical protein